MSVPPPCRPGNGGSAAAATTETAGELLRRGLWLLRPLGLRRHLFPLRPWLVVVLLLLELQRLRLRRLLLRLRLRRLLLQLDLLRDAELERPIARAKSPHNRGCWLAGKIEPQRHMSGSLELLVTSLELLVTSLELLGASFELLGAFIGLLGASIELLEAACELLVPP